MYNNSLIYIYVYNISGWWNIKTLATSPNTEVAQKNGFIPWPPDQLPHHGAIGAEEAHGECDVAGGGTLRWNGSVVFSVFSGSGVPSGKHTKNYGKSPCWMGKFTISMAIFNSYGKLPEGTLTMKNRHFSHGEFNINCLIKLIESIGINGWLVVSNMAFIFHNIWDNPSHWLSYFSRWLKPPTRWGLNINHGNQNSRFDFQLECVSHR